MESIAKIDLYYSLLTNFTILTPPLASILHLTPTVTTIKNLEVVDSIILGEYILERGGRMSHLKLQKILYYIQGLHLAYFEAPLIDDDFQAWLHGPVSRKLYDHVKGHSILYSEVEYVKTAEQNPSEVLEDILTQDQMELVNEVIDEYSKLTSSQLENLTHSELPWQEARQGYSAADRCEVVISKETMQTFYKSQIYGG